MRKERRFAILILAAAATHAQTVNTVAGNGERGVGADGAISTVAGNGQMAGFFEKLRKVDTNGSFSFAPAFSGDGGKATNAGLYFPKALAVDADTGSHRIRKVTLDGQIDSIADSVEDVEGMAAGVNGNLYYSDNAQATVRRIDPARAVAIVAGTDRASGSSGDGGPATAAQFNAPQRVAVDAAANVYIVYANNYRVSMVTAAQ